VFRCDGWKIGDQRVQVGRRGDLRRLADGLVQERADVASVRVRFAICGREDGASRHLILVMVVVVAMTVVMIVAAPAVRMVLAAVGMVRVTVIVVMRRVRDDVEAVVMVMTWDERMQPFTNEHHTGIGSQQRATQEFVKLGAHRALDRRPSL
jgi:hypothetical protein